MSLSADQIDKMSAAALAEGRVLAMNPADVQDLLSELRRYQGMTADLLQSKARVVVVSEQRKEALVEAVRILDDLYTRAQYTTGMFGGPSGYVVSRIDVEQARGRLVRIVR